MRREVERLIPEIPPEYCALERAPFVASRRARDDDRDGNTLDDGVERQMARCLAPEFRFDSAENENPEGVMSLEPHEPHLLFSSYRVGPDIVLLRFVALFRNDGGFVLDDAWPHCGDAHAGDSQRFAVRARVVSDAGAWYVVPLGTSELNGSHPVVYATAGKHHFHDRPSHRCYPVKPFGCCWDRADGKGIRVIPGQGRGQIAHVAAQVGQSPRGGPLPGFQAADLGNLGFVGRSLWTDFYSSTARPPGPELALGGAEHTAPRTSVRSPGKLRATLSAMGGFTSTLERVHRLLGVNRSDRELSHGGVGFGRRAPP